MKKGFLLRETSRVNVPESLFQTEIYQKDDLDIVIEDKEEIRKYPLQKVKNKIILGDTFKVLKKLGEEIVDLVFIDPPYFYSCQIKKN